MMDDYDQGRVDAIDCIGRDMRKRYDRIGAEIENSYSLSQIGNMRIKADLLRQIIEYLEEFKGSIAGKPE